MGRGDDSTRIRTADFQLATGAITHRDSLLAQQITEGDPIRHRALWGTATASFAVGQASAAFGTVFLIDEFGEQGLAYPLLFAVAAAALTIAFLMDFAIRR